MRLSLTKQCEYGIRLLLHLAAQPAEQRMTAGELAEACDISAGNVPTIVNVLARSGILICSPGRGGGCELAVDPADISMLQIIEVLDGPLEVAHCLLDSRAATVVTPSARCTTRGARGATRRSGRWPRRPRRCAPPRA